MVPIHQRGRDERIGWLGTKSGLSTWYLVYATSGTSSNCDLGYIQKRAFCEYSNTYSNRSLEHNYTVNEMRFQPWSVENEKELCQQYIHTVFQRAISEHMVARTLISLQTLQRYK